MARITIPEVYHAGLEKLISLPDEAIAELASKLQNARPSLYDEEYLSRLTPNMTTMAHDDARVLVEALYSMSVGRVAAAVPVSDFVEDVVEAIQQGRGKALTLAPLGREKFEERLTVFLELDVFKIGAKAVNVLYEHQHVVISPRTLTDIRAVFGEDVDAPPIGAVIVHTLKIEYREGHERKEFFVAMDTRDVQVMIDVLERAKSKADNLKSAFLTGAVPQIDFE